MSMLMTNVICIFFSMQEEYIVEHIGYNKCHVFMFRYAGRRSCWLRIRGTQAKSTL